VARDIRPTDLFKNSQILDCTRTIGWRSLASSNESLCGRKEHSPPSRKGRTEKKAHEVVNDAVIATNRDCTAVVSSDLFTALHFARALRCSKQNIHQRLVGVAADDERMINGNLAKVWRIESLPSALARQLSEKAELMRCRTVADLLRAPADRYEPGVPLSQIAPGAIEKARKLRAALLPLIALRDNLAISAAEFAKRGVESYERAFGFAISAGHWRTLFDRTVDRAHYQCQRRANAVSKFLKTRWQTSEKRRN
jgi:hypothetical protein